VGKPEAEASLTQVEDREVKKARSAGQPSATAFAAGFGHQLRFTRKCTCFKYFSNGFLHRKRILRSVVAPKETCDTHKGIIGNIKQICHRAKEVYKCLVNKRLRQ
jgi:hypothetical protein